MLLVESIEIVEKIVPIGKISRFRSPTIFKKKSRLRFAVDNHDHPDTTSTDEFVQAYQALGFVCTAD